MRARRLDTARRLTSQLVANSVSEDDEVRWRIVNSRPALQARLVLRTWASDRQLAAKLHAAYPNELDEVVAAALVGAVTSGLRAAASRPAGAPRSAREGQLVIDRLVCLVEHGLESSH